MIYPTIVVDNFFKNPEKIVELSSTLPYHKDPNGRWPGVRSEFLHICNQGFFEMFHKKIFALLYPNQYRSIKWLAETNFQKVSAGRDNVGKVHQDLSEITAIVYLSKHKGCGTSLWKNNNFIPSSHEQNPYLDEPLNEKKINSIKEWNNTFEKTFTADSYFNRLLIFDSGHHHSAEKFFDEDVDGDRITLITFISKIEIQNEVLKTPLTECSRVE